VDSRGLKIAGFLALVAGCLALFYFAHSRPGYFSSATYLGGLIFLQLLFIALWNFRQTFFAFLMISFVWAGIDLPWKSAWTAGRWAVLAAGALVGLAIFLQDRRYRFAGFHVVALTCVLVALFSATVSAAAPVALLKAASLLILFLYAASGGRLAILGREDKFFRGLLLACEIIVYLTSFAYIVLGLQTWGNPNSLGLVMGVVVAPLLLWGLLIAETPSLRLRRTLALSLAVILLVNSLARASIVACAASMILLGVVLRRYKMLLRGSAAVLGVVALLAILAPAKLQEFASESTSTVVYKGKREAGLMGSRRTPWQKTVSAIGEHPWLGVGFGTVVSGDETQRVARFASTRNITREHGNSYLAILEWMGLLGVVPFYGLVLILLSRIVRAARWIHARGDLYHPCLPLIMVLLAGLIHATFEDWLFAVGYYMCVFFWTLAFAFIDLVPGRAAVAVHNPYLWPASRMNSAAGA
jgi:O-antigen ligase